MTDLEKLVTILDKSDDEFLSEIKKSQVSIFAAVKKVLAKFSVKNGNLDKGDATNRQLLLKVKNDIIGSLKKSTYPNKVRKYLSDFDKVTDLNKKVMGSVMTKRLADSITQEQKDTVRQITLALLSEDAIEANLATPIRKIMYRHITSGISVKQAEAELRTHIQGDERAGAFERYVRTYAREALSRYDGTITQMVVNDTEAPYFRIVGSLIKNSHVNCVEMVNGTGVLGSYTLGRGVYPSDKLDEMLAVMGNRSGFVQGTNETNYFVNKNHWGCRHKFLPVYEVDVPAQNNTAQNENIASELGVAANFKNMTIDNQQAFVEALQKVPKDARPDYIGTGSDYTKVTGRKLPRTHKQYYGVAVETDGLKLDSKFEEIMKSNDRLPPQLRKLSGDRITKSVDGNILVNGTLNSVFISPAIKKPGDITTRKKAFNKRYREKYDKDFFFNTEEKATFFHEFGHVLDNRKRISGSREWEILHSRWMKNESATGNIASASEAFAEAFADMFLTGGDKLPGFVKVYMKELLKL